MAVTTVMSATTLPGPVPDLKTLSVVDTQSVDLDLNDSTHLPVPPELPDIPLPATVTLPNSMDGFSPEMQARITAYIEKNYPDAETEADIDTILHLLLHVIEDTPAANCKPAAAPSKLTGSSNAARQISSLAWKYLPKSKKHQVYGAVASEYEEASQLASSYVSVQRLLNANTHQSPDPQLNILEEYPVLLTESQMDAIQGDIRSRQKISEACEQYEQTANSA